MANQKVYFEAKDELRKKLIEICGEKYLSTEQVLLLLNELQGEVIQNAIKLKL